MTSSGSGGVASGSGGASSGEGGDCGNGGTAGTGAGGEGAAAGAGGGGAGGAAGDAGTAGDGGAGAAGDAGTAGNSGGVAGAGGAESGGAAGSGGAGAGGAGQGGSAGVGGDAGAGGGCAQGEAPCGGNCVDLANNPEHCGACGNACADQESCDAGSCVVVPICGNGVPEPGEECDGPLAVDCAGFLGEGFGGAPACTAQCTVNLSACAYCGNGVRDAHESCEGANLGGATCGSLGAGNGQLSCKSCQHDLSGCSGGICGYSNGLDNTAWAAEGGCMKRPNQSRLLGPAGTGGTFHAPGGVATAFSPQLVVNPQGNLIFQGGTSLYRWSGTSLITTKNTPHTGAATLLIRSNGTAFRVTDQNVATISSPNSTNPDLNTGTNNQGGGPLTTNVVIVENVAYYARADGKMLRTALGLGSLLFTETHHISPVGIRGSIAHDPEEDRLYVPQDCSKVGDLPCKLLALSRSSGSKVWEADIGPATSAPCHAAVGAGGIVYATCGAQARFFLPQNPLQLTASFSVGAGGLALAPALRADGTVYLLFDGDNPVLLATTPQLQVLWSRTLVTRPLGAPLLDAAGNVYLCLQDRVVSHDPEGEPRWAYLFQTEENTGCAMAISAAGQLDVVTSSGAYRIQGP